MNLAFFRKASGHWHGFVVSALAGTLFALPPATALAQHAKNHSHARENGLSGELFYEILLGELHLSQGDNGLGLSLLLDAARKTNDPALYSRCVDVALQARSGDGALSAARAWTSAWPQDRQANSQLLQILIALGRVEESQEVLKNSIALAPDVERNFVIGLIPRQYARVNDKKLAADTVQQALEPFLRQKTTAAAAWAAVGRMRLQQDDTAAALQAARQGSSADPSADGPALLALELMTRKIDGAEALVQQALPHQSNGNLAMTYVRALVEQQRFNEAQDQLDRITRQYPQQAEAWLVLGAMQFEQGQEQQAETSLARYVALAEQSPNANTTRGLAQAQARRAELLARHGRLDEGRQLIERLPASTDDEARTRLQAEVQLLRDHQQWQAAYDLLAQKNPDNADLRYEQAMLAEKLGRYDDMEKLLRAVLAQEPEYANAYNALGFSLADRKLRLNEAKQLIVQAVKLAPDDPFIIDSLGWVEFRLGNYAAALLQLQKAYQARPDPEIGAHLGEVLWKLKREDEARRIWREALQLAPDNETLRETLQRLQPAL